MSVPRSVAVIAAAGLWGAALMVAVQPVRSASIPDVLLEDLRQGAALDSYLSDLLERLRRADVDDDGLSSADIELARSQERARSRASAVEQILRYDLDGDMLVTREEIVSALRTQRDDGNLHAQAERELKRADRNGDGKVTMAEAAASATNIGRRDQLGDLLALDPDRDGRLQVKELRAVATQAFATADSDGDERISAAEFASVEPRVREAITARHAPQCAMPPLAAGAQLLAVGAYEGDAVSSVFIGGPDEETTLIEVAIEPGSQPLYLVLASYESMVWRFTGATERVARVVVSSHGDGTALSPSGVAGVPARRVTVAPPRCPEYFKASGRQPAQAATIRRSLGREPDSMFGSYSMQRIALPSGTITEAKRGAAARSAGFDAEMWDEAVRFWPAGLVTVPPGRVAAKAPVAPYSVLPSQMGLSQLLGSGAIERTESGAYRIVRPIAHMPPSMGGAHSVTLILAKGVPLPPGDPVHSCIIDEATGHSTGATCSDRR